MKMSACVVRLLVGFVILAAATMPARAAQPVARVDDGVIIQLKKRANTDAALMKVQVCSDRIIRIMATAADDFPARPSLMVAKERWEAAPFELTQAGNLIEIATAALIVRVNQETGQVGYYQPDGRPILQERSGGGKVLQAARVMDEATWHVQQVFETPEAEAFYGLGQHQNGLMNYRGHAVDLWQYNTVAVVPFVLSTNNYGILWDNNSRTRFGDTRDYLPLAATLSLYDSKAQAGGLAAEYYKDANFGQLFLRQMEQQIHHPSLQDQDSWPAGFKPDFNASIRWSGQMQAPESGVHTFRLYSSHYARLWLDGKQVVDSWRQNWCPWTYIVPLTMEAGKRYDIKLEWIPNGGYIGLQHLGPVPEEQQNELSLYSEVADQIDYYFIYGQNADEVISGYRTITGVAPMLPKWAMGLWQCRERYKTQEELLEVVREFRRRQIPLDAIVQDWFYWPEDKWGDHDFDLTRYPDPQRMVKELHEKLNTHVMISVWPKFYVGTEHYRQFEQQGWLYRRNVEKQEKDWVGSGYVSTFYDPYSQGARELFWKQIKAKLFDKGFDAWWLDATEPDIHSNLSPEEYRLRIGPTALGSAARYLNTFSLMNARGIYEGQRSATDQQRVFILTRSAFAGQQRYSGVTWSGDIATRWHDLKVQIPAGLNFCMSGLPYWTTDIGGFAVEPRFERNVKPDDLEEWRELQTRWFQYGAFCPLFRVHGQFPYREMFNTAPDNHPAYQTMVAYDKLRYRLMPYIYSLCGRVTQQNYTIMRGLVMDFGADQNVWNIADQFMYGPALLVNPVTDYKARERAVYLPAGCGWYEFKSGGYYPGGQTIQADAPLTDMPLYVRTGSIIPSGPAIEYALQGKPDPIRLTVYTGQDGAFTLYEDEGVNYNYEKGAFSQIPLKWDQQKRTLTIGARQGTFPGMLMERTFEIVWIDGSKPRGFDPDGKPDKTVMYKGQEITVKP